MVLFLAESPSGVSSILSINDGLCSYVLGIDFTRKSNFFICGSLNCSVLFTIYISTFINI